MEAEGWWWQGTKPAFPNQDLQGWTYSGLPAHVLPAWVVQGGNALPILSQDKNKIKVSQGGGQQQPKCSFFRHSGASQQLHWNNRRKTWRPPGSITHICARLSYSCTKMVTCCWSGKILHGLGGLYKNKDIKHRHLFIIIFFSQAVIKDSKPQILSLQDTRNERKSICKSQIYYLFFKIVTFFISKHIHMGGCSNSSLKHCFFKNCISLLVFD